MAARGLAVVIAAVLSQGQVAPRTGAPDVSPHVSRAIDSLFARWTTTSLPGCTIGVSRDRHQVVSRAYGRADLEHGIANQPDSIIEAGSVSKQFTAAAVLLLALDGKLSLDDPVRKYIPEVPDYGVPMTIRHLITHTSGLRDWGTIATIGGWPRTSRAYTHAHVLDIVNRPRQSGRLVRAGKAGTIDIDPAIAALQDDGLVVFGIGSSEPQCVLVELSGHTKVLDRERGHGVCIS